MFSIGNKYKRSDIHSILNVPEDKRKGNFDKGLVKYDNSFYLFVNIGIAGSVGSDYNNYWDGDLLHWKSANNANVSQPMIIQLLNQELPIRVFTRMNTRDAFTYEGLAGVSSYEVSIPVKIIWQFNNPYENRNERIAEEILPETLTEGVSKSILVNKYERNPIARRLCIEHYGLQCQVCNFNFHEFYGEIGRDFIHVHHLKLMSEIKQEYVIDPINDLIPVCANCHAMLHKANPPILISDLKKLLKNRERNA